MLIGAQLYTTHAFCRDLDSFAETLKKVADIGYKTVQVSGTCAYEPLWLKEQLDKNGLKCVITHTPLDKLKDAKKSCEDHRIFDCKYLGLGAYKITQENLASDYEQLKQALMPIAKGIKENGGYFMYHNHHYEFMKLEGKTILRKMAEDFPADELGFTLDTFWVQAGGANPVEYIEEFAGRIPCIHLKDYGVHKLPDESYGYRYMAVGDGNLNFERIVNAAAKSGVEYMLVEQDDCYGEDPFACLKRSYDHLRALGLE